MPNLMAVNLLLAECTRHMQILNFTTAVILLITKSKSVLTYNILMVNQFHEFKLSVGPLGVCYVLEGSGQLLNCNILLGHCVICRTHDSLEKKEKIYQNILQD